MWSLFKRWTVVGTRRIFWWFFFKLKYSTLYSNDLVLKSDQRNSKQSFETMTTTFKWIWAVLSEIENWNFIDLISLELLEPLTWQSNQTIFHRVKLKIFSKTFTQKNDSLNYTKSFWQVIALTKLNFWKNDKLCYQITGIFTANNHLAVNDKVW